MAGTSKKNWEDLDITKEEVENLKEALKKEVFRKLLAEYAEEITDPKNRKQYQDEIIQLEAERGVDCTFINPEPGFVVKTSVDGTKKAFINICKSSVIGRPSSKPVINENNKGLNWSIPFSQAPAREDHDKKRNRCVVYDVVFHPETLHLAGKSPQFRQLVVDTALCAIEDSYKVKLDKKNIRYPRLKFKGIPFATVIRKKSKTQPILTEEEIEFQKIINYPVPPPIDGNAKPVIRNFDTVKEDKEKYTIPKFTIKHRKGIDLEEFTYDKNGKINIAIPKELVIEVNLPLLNSTKEVTLDVMKKSLHLLCKKPAMYKLDIQLPYEVSEEKGNAKFDREKRILIVTLPVIKANMTITDIMREDSGVESDFGDRCPSWDDASPIGSVSTIENEINEVEGASNNGSEPVSLQYNLTQIKTCENVKEVSEPFQIKQDTSFLDADKQYLLPPCKCNIDNNNICFILNVKNVDPESVFKKWQGSNSCHLKFLSIGSGFFPVFYAFLVKFSEDCVINDVIVDVWDNNVTFQVQLDNSKSISSCLIGTDENSLTLKDLSEAIQLEKKLEKMKLNLKLDQEPLDTDHDSHSESSNVNVSVEAADREEVVIKITPEVKKDVHEGTSKKDKSKAKTLPQIVDKKRTFSESSIDELISQSPVARKSILKNHISWSLSESNTEDYPLGSSVEASEGSDLCNVHSEDSEEPSSFKKTVRFNNRISKQTFRANSSILGRKKKNQKRSRNKRKVSEKRSRESENSDCEDKEKNDGTNSESPLIEELEENNSDDNCDITDTVITEENENLPEEPRNEVRFTAKKDDKIFEFKSELIFDLDL